MKWDNEPNKEEFEAHGLKCFVNRVMGLGHLCGYVGVQSEHPLFGKEYNDLVKVDPSEFSKKIDMDRVGVLNLFYAGAKNNEETIKQNLLELCLALECHGGLTYSGKASFLTNDESYWFFGFDAAHAGDLRPLNEYSFDGVYRDFEYIKNDTINLAKQISEWPRDHG